MAFNESNAVKAYLYDLLSGSIKTVPTNAAKEPQTEYGRASKGLGWRRVASTDIPRQPQEVLVESWMREALIRLNPEIAAQPIGCADVRRRINRDRCASRCSAHPTALRPRRA